MIGRAHAFGRDQRRGAHDVLGGVIRSARAATQDDVPIRIALRLDHRRRAIGHRSRENVCG